MTEKEHACARGRAWDVQYAWALCIPPQVGLDVQVTWFVQRGREGIKRAVAALRDSLGRNHL